MTARVHFSRMARGIFKLILLLNKQCIHIGAQCNVIITVPTSQHTDNTGFGQPLMHLNTDLLQLIGDQLGCYGFLKCSFGMLVYLPAPLAHGVMQGKDFWINIHCFFYKLIIKGISKKPRFVTVLRYSQKNKY